MGDAQGISAPSLPAWALYPVTLLLTALMAAILLRVRSRAARFVIFACWFRYVLRVFHQFTFHPSPFGMSWIGLASVAVCALGFFVLRQKRLGATYYLPLYVLGAIVVVSGMANHSYVAILNNVAKLGYLMVVAAGTVEAMEDLGAERFLKSLLWSFAPPLVYQVLSVVLNVYKAGEEDGSASYIGGYNHEGSFSIVIATCLLVAVFNGKLRPWTKTLLVVGCMVGILLANYRTTILAMAPLLLLQFATGIPSIFKRRQQAAVLGTMVIGSAFLFLVAAWIVRDRFTDIAVLAEQGTHLIKPPDAFTPDDRHLLSGRAWVWSTYIYGYIGGTSLQHLIGFGPDAWEDVFPLYAHNTLISYLYEYGVVGIAGILFLWAWMFQYALRAGPSRRPKLIAAHLSFFVLNMATMPHWQIEGNILYGVLCGITIASVRERRRRPVVVRPPRLPGLAPATAGPALRGRAVDGWGFLRRHGTDATRGPGEFLIRPTVHGTG